MTTPHTETAAGLPIGISGSDFIPVRGHVSDDVYASADYLEYGGHFPPADDPGVRTFCSKFPDRGLGRHLVSTELPTEIDIDEEVDIIRRDIAGCPVEYLVTDFCFWRLGGRTVDSLWFRPLKLDRSAARHIAVNALRIQDVIGLPFYVENPPYVYVPEGLDLVEFLNDLASRGTNICLDIGHFVGWCFNGGYDVAEKFAGLPMPAIRMSHVAGLSRVAYRRTELLIDNHNVPPGREVLAWLTELLASAPNLERITYEAELAPTDTQLTGMRKLRELAR